MRTNSCFGRTTPTTWHQDSHGRRNTSGENLHFRVQTMMYYPKSTYTIMSLFVHTNEHDTFALIIIQKMTICFPIPAWNLQ